MQNCAMTGVSINTINNWFRDRFASLLLPKYMKRIQDSQLFEDISDEKKHQAIHLYLKNTHGVGVSGVVTQSILSEMGSVSGLDEMTIKKMIPTV